VALAVPLAHASNCIWATHWCSVLCAKAACCSCSGLNHLCDEFLQYMRLSHLFQVMHASQVEQPQAAAAPWLPVAAGRCARLPFCRRIRRYTFVTSARVCSCASVELVSAGVHELRLYLGCFTRVDGVVDGSLVCWRQKSRFLSQPSWFEYM